MKTLEEKQAEAREWNKKRRYKKMWKTRRAIAKATKPKGKFSTKADAWSFSRCMLEYKKEFGEIIDLTLATLRSQTKQSHPNKDIDYLSKRLLWKFPYINVDHIDREDIESELTFIWWKAFKRSREKGWMVKTNMLKYASWYLPSHIKPYVTAVYRTNTDEISYELNAVEPFNIDLDYVINGSEVWPASLYNRQERYLIFLLQEYPGEYAKIARMMQLSKVAIWKLVNQLRARTSEELDYNARQNTTRPSERRSLVSA